MELQVPVLVTQKEGHANESTAAFFVLGLLVQFVIVELFTERKKVFFSPLSILFQAQHAPVKMKSVDDAFPSGELSFRFTDGVCVEQ